MADISITAANVAKGASAVLVNTGALAGEAIVAGKVVYLKSADNTWRLAQSDGTAEEAGSAVQIGIALNAAGIGQPVYVQTGGVIAIGGTAVIGTVYCISAAAGNICPWADLASTNKVTILGVGATASTIDLTGIKVGYTGVAIP